MSSTIEATPINGFKARSAQAFESEALPEGSKWSFVTRNVPTDAVSHAELRREHLPQAGDLILARVERIAQHTRIQLRCGRRSQLYPGDPVIVSFGHRYAPDQFEATIPTELDSCHLVAAGGIAALAVSKHAGLKWPTSLRPEGYCVDAEGAVVNLGRYGLSTPIGQPAARKPVIAVLGTSMNAGKTTAAASLVKGLKAAGYRVAAVKATGTGAGNDLWAYADAGADLTLDFTDAGHPSTFRLPQADINNCFLKLLSICDAHQQAEVTVVELADGLLQPETARLVESDAYRGRVQCTLFAAAEAMGAVAGVDMLARSGVVPAALVGLLTASKLAAAEAERATGIRTLEKLQLETPAAAISLLR